MRYAKVKNLDNFMKGKGYIKANDLFTLVVDIKEEPQGIQIPKVIKNNDN